MADRNPKVYELVQQELEKNPGLGSKELYTILQAKEKSVGQDTLQQFHARYVLPAKRERKGSTGAKAAKPGRRGRKKEARESSAPATAGQQATRKTRRARRQEPDRDGIRGVLLQFAQDITDAESRSTLVQVLSRVDRYVDRVAAAAAK